MPEHVADATIMTRRCLCTSRILTFHIPEQTLHVLPITLISTGMMLGLMLKVMHWPGGQLITGSMIMVQVIAIVWLIMIIARSKN